MAARKRARAQAAARDPKDRLIDVALDLAAERGWRNLSMAEIAEAADLSLRETYDLIRSKPGLVAAFRRRIDEAMLEAGPISGDTTRDRLFDGLMRRFEALKPHRPGIRVILRDSVGDPAALCYLPGLMRSMAWTLAAAGLPSSGLRARWAEQVLGGVYLSVMPTFFRDEGADLGTTMAALDRRLRQAESLLGVLAPVGGGRGRRVAG
jgi:AcrR family transcriptional regulator